MCMRVCACVRVCACSSRSISATVKVTNDKPTVSARRCDRKRISKSDVSGPSNFV